MVEFYAPWCGHCKNLAPEYKKLAQAFHGIVPIVAIDADDKSNAPLASRYSIQGFPTLKLIINGKATDYSGARTAAAMQTELLNAIKNHTNSKLGTNSSGGSSSSNSNSNSNNNDGQTAAIEANDSNFDQYVYNETKPTILFFYAPWCGHCKALKPDWNKASLKLKDKVRFVQYDADANKGKSAE